MRIVPLPSCRVPSHWASALRVGIGRPPDQRTTTLTPAPGLHKDDAAAGVVGIEGGREGLGRVGPLDGDVIGLGLRGGLLSFGAGDAVTIAPVPTEDAEPGSPRSQAAQREQGAGTRLQRD